MDWVYGWWDGKQVNTEKYVPSVTEEEEIQKRKKERSAILKELERKKREIAILKEKTSESTEHKSDAAFDNEKIISNSRENHEVLEAPVSSENRSDTNISNNTPKSGSCDGANNSPNFM